ncbi:MAG: type II toxin-antitoxin system VapC family toxin [Alphaproteobacteria bacterium]|nr:type II toxin-antitoxin system VapC family toxin [Alphaproteobacteria bacterium]
MFIDSSALVALLAREPEAKRIAAVIEAAPLRRVIPLVLLESAMVLASRLNIEPAIAEQAITAVIEEADIIVVPETRETAQAALTAFARHGKGRGHKAQLNLADCMVYAAARLADAPLLFLGDDFARTDIASVLPRRTRR